MKTTHSVLNFFEQISKIPRNSGNEKGMQQFLVNFAKSRNLPYYADEFNNVIIFKKTCEKEPVILQAHTDMVCVKKPKSTHNFEKDGIQLVYKNDILTAKNTSLGADDGIGVALILDILDTVKECNIEAVFTASEETTMRGALTFDTKRLKSKNLICLDGFNMGEIITSSASFTDFYINIGQDKTFINNTPELKTFNLTLTGLEGGHSGFDIDKNRGCSHKLLASLLLKIPQLTLNSFSGGDDYNIIPSHAKATFSCSLPLKTLKGIVKEFYTQSKKAYKTLKIKCERTLNKTLIIKNGTNLLKFIENFKHGVLHKDEKGRVISSQNLAVIDTEKGYIKVGIRNNDPQIEKEVIKALKDYCKNYNFDGEIANWQPSFNTLENSTLLQNLHKTNSRAVENKVHFTVECGIFQDRMKKLDVVIISPTIRNAHSVKETLSINSVIETSNWLKEFLKL